MSTPTSLALFDLDHTLIPFDSGMSWFRFLATRGEAAATLPDEYLDRCYDYLAGRSSATALHHFVATTFAGRPLPQLQALQADFAATIAPLVPPAAHRLVAQHLARGHRCCIVTATNRFVASVFARELGIDALIATELETTPNGFSGQLQGAVCHGQEKVSRVEAWLDSRGLDTDALADAAFYSDSASDIPLLERVHHPVVVSPDPRLREHAEARGWRLVDTLDML